MRKKVNEIGCGWEIIASLPDQHPRSCRFRYLSSLHANKRLWTAKDDKKLLLAIATLGKRWKAISQLFVNNPRHLLLVEIDIVVY